MYDKSLVSVYLALGQVVVFLCNGVFTLDSIGIIICMVLKVATFWKRADMSKKLVSPTLFWAQYTGDRYY